MACTFPMPAYTAEKGLRPLIGIPSPTKTVHEKLLLPCGKCTGCIMSKAREWALRCQLELQDHDTAVFTTLTYDEKQLPKSLKKRDLQLWLKKLRKEMGPERPLRFFASGEYGGKTKRPHYHAILFGADTSKYDKDLIQKTWGKGHTYTLRATPATIAYVAGYTAKKMGDRDQQRIDKEWQPPFIQMSRRPGIGGSARRHTANWRDYAIKDGIKMPVPRFYHEAWKKTATAEQIEQNQLQKKIRAQQHNITLQQLSDQEKINTAKQAIREAKRTKI